MEASAEDRGVKDEKKSRQATVLGRRRLQGSRKRPRGRVPVKTDASHVKKEALRSIVDAPAALAAHSVKREIKSEAKQEIKREIKQQDEDVAFQGVVGDVFPHLRESCPAFAFPSDAQHFCDKCFCFACDIPASECDMWPAHCIAISRDPDWKRIRKSLRKERELSGERPSRIALLESEQNEAVARYEAARPRKKPKQRPSHPLLRCGCRLCVMIHEDLRIGVKIKIKQEGDDDELVGNSVTLDMGYSERKHAMDMLDACRDIEYELHGADRMTISLLNMPIYR